MGMSRFRLDPTPHQEEILSGHCSHARFVWNLAIEQSRHWRRGRTRAPGYAEQCRQLTEARAENPWLVAGSQTVQQQSLRDFQQAMSNFFNRSHGRPTWRKAGKDEGFRIVGRHAQKVRRVSRNCGEVWVPKVGWVRFRWSRQVPAANSYRVTMDRARRWHIAFAAAPEPTTPPGNGDVVGVDRGVIVSAALSNGELLTVPGLRPKESERLLRLRRRLARATKGSRRRARLKAEAARICAREADRRRDCVEKTSTRLARDFELIAVEDLKIKQMTRSARGTKLDPAANGKAKAALNRGILSAGWGQLVRRLDDKAPGRVVRINPAFTSQRCNDCGEVDRRSRKSQSVFRCTSCGHTAHADVNAARNIRDDAIVGASRGLTITAAGRAVAARGGGPPGQPVNREPQFLRVSRQSRLLGS